MLNDLFFNRSLVNLFSLAWPSSFASLELLLLFLLVLRFNEAIVYDACISFLCLSSSSIYNKNKEQKFSGSQTRRKEKREKDVEQKPQTCHWKPTACISCVYLLVISENCARTYQDLTGRSKIWWYVTTTVCNACVKVLTSLYSLSNFGSSALLDKSWASTFLRFSFSSLKGAAQKASIV